MDHSFCLTLIGGVSTALCAVAASCWKLMMIILKMTEERLKDNREISKMLVAGLEDRNDETKIKGSD